MVDAKSTTFAVFCPVKHGTGTLPRVTPERPLVAPVPSEPVSRTFSMAAHEAKDVEKRSTPASPVIYEVVRRFGDEEMSRPASSLWWSGVAAGLSISFSLLAESILALRVPEGSWQPLVIALGFPVGFLMVVLGRQQLFTENTITVVLPLMAERSRENFRKAARVWWIVLAANLCGTLLAALFCTFTPAISPEVRDSMLELGRRAMDKGWVEMLSGGVTAGFLMATMVWLQPGADTAQFLVIAVITYLIGISESAHIVTGSVEAFMLVANGQGDAGGLLLGFGLPVLAGNIVGGTVLFTMISYGQVMKEMHKA